MKTLESLDKLAKLAIVIVIALYWNEIISFAQMFAK